MNSDSGLLGQLALAYAVSHQRIALPCPPTLHPCLQMGRPLA